MIGPWTVTSLVPSGNVASTWTDSSISGTPSMTSSRASTERPALISSATVRPSRAPSSTKEVMIATASGWLSFSPRARRRSATSAATVIEQPFLLVLGQSHRGEPMPSGLPPVTWVMPRRAAITAAGVYRRAVTALPEAGATRVPPPPPPCPRRARRRGRRRPARHRPGRLRAATTVVDQGFRLLSSQSLTSTANGYRLTMQADGNLVQYSDFGVPLWASGTAGRGASTLSLQGDGNLVVRTGAGVATWASGAHGTSLSGRRRQHRAAVGLHSGVVHVRHPVPAGGGDAVVVDDRSGDARRRQVGHRRPQPHAADRRQPGAAQRLERDLDHRDRDRQPFDAEPAERRQPRAPRRRDGRPRWSSGTRARAPGSLQSGHGRRSDAPHCGRADTVWRVGTAGPSTAPTGVAGDVFVLLNQERAANGLPPLSDRSRLILSATRHNLAMSAADTLSHQLPGEADPGGRIAAAGYPWRAWAENIAWTSDQSAAGARSVQAAMYNETRPTTDTGATSCPPW